MPWYQDNPSLFQQECSAVKKSYPSLCLEIKPKGYWLSSKPSSVCRTPKTVISGIYRIDPLDSDSVGYKGNLLVPDSYPRINPRFYIDDKAIEYIPDRHMIDDGEACLCVRAEYRKHWSVEDGLVGFLDCLVQPFVIGQYSYSKTGKWPWEARDHGAKGIFQAYTEITGFADQRIILEFMRMMSTDKVAKGRIKCPCGSGLKLRDCHAELYKSLRSKYRWEDVAVDYRTLMSFYYR